MAPTQWECAAWEPEGSAMIGRTLSAGIAAVYVAGAYAYVGGERAFAAAVAVIFPLACIWFPEELGRYTGPLGLRGYIQKRTPGAFVAFGGWVLLTVIGIFWLLRVLGGYGSTWDWFRY